MGGKRVHRTTVWASYFGHDVWVRSFERGILKLRWESGYTNYSLFRRLEAPISYGWNYLSGATRRCTDNAIKTGVRPIFDRHNAWAVLTGS